MRAEAALIAALLSTANALHQFAPRSLNESAASDATPKRYIVELKSRAHGSRVASKASSGLPGLRVVKQFDSDIFPGIAVECDHGCTAESIQSSLDGSDGEPVVASVYKSQMLQLLPTVEGESFSDDAAAVNYSVHGLTGVQNLHEDGILGEGAVVAIVDSGVQYTHPALGGGLGDNYTVIGGYDLVGDAWPDAPAQPDNDPMDRYGHGTHVAGIIAGQSDQFVGVAPKSKLLSFKVFGSSGYSNEETVIEGFLKAFDSGADIISASVGEGSGFTNNALAVVASRIVDNGVVVVFAAGNSGQDGPFSMANGASGKHVLTVASSDPGVFPAQAFSANFNLDGNSNDTEVAYVPGSGFFPDTIIDWPIKPIILNASVENDACQPLPADTPQLNETVVLVRLGGCTVSTKHTNVAAFGAQYILFYNNLDIYQSPVSSNRVGLTGAIEGSAGEAIVSTILAGGNVTASFNIDTAHYVGIRNAGGGRPALYSSWGSTYDLALKPDVSGPGTKILSTYPTNEYRVLSGTSMATPYLSGIAALWVGKFGGRSAHKDDPEWAKRLIARITTTARAVPWADWATSVTDYGFWAPTTQVGGGLVDAERVLGYTTELSFDGRKFELNDTVHFTGTHTVDITNQGSESVTYKFSLQDAGGYESYEPSVPGQQQTFIPAIPLYAEINPVKMTPEVALPAEVAVGPGETKTVDFTFNLTREAQDFPKLTTRLLWGTEELRWDIFHGNYSEAEWSYPPVVGEKGFVGSATSWNGTASSSWFIPGEDSEDDIFSFPLYTQPNGRNGIYYWLGRYANGSQVLPGSYTFRIAALRPFGVREVAEDWDIWKTPAITVLPGSTFEA
ncbi:Minor extracellular protease vpr [Colletotrichum sp. SAR 10_98]|nr:Minor extracellular protease vpr [Colletotrichum sp. SAR 10_98]